MSRNGKWSKESCRWKSGRLALSVKVTGEFSDGNPVGYMGADNSRQEETIK